MYLLLVAALLPGIAAVQPTEPNRQPELATADGITALVFGSGNSIWFSSSKDEGRSFSKPGEVTQVTALALGRHRGPHVAISGKTIVVSAIYGEPLTPGPHSHGLPAHGDLVAWRSTDGGRSWSQPAVINDVPGSAREGLHAMAAGAGGEIAAAWLDLRSSSTRLYGAYSENGGLSWSRNVLLYESGSGTICQCCHPSLVSAGNHQFEVMFRNVKDGARDLYLTRWALGSLPTTAEKVGQGSWKLDACPMDGGGIAQRGSQTVTAWRRDHTVYLAEAGKPEIPVGEGKDVTLALSRRGPVVAWTALSGVALYRDSTRTTSALSVGGSFPSLVSLSNGSVLAAWEQNREIQMALVD